jgi:hypothetical protein
MTTVKLTQEELEQGRERAEQIYMNAQYVGLPPYQNMSIDKFRTWVEERKAAAAKIDVETCEVEWCFGYIIDPYGLHAALGELTDEERCVGRLYYVCSPDSDGWVNIRDLSSTQREGLDARLARTGLPDDTL